MPVGLGRLAVLLLPAVVAAAQDPAPVLAYARTPEGRAIILRLQFRKGLSVEGRALPKAFLARGADAGGWLAFESLSPQGKRWALAALFPEDQWRQEEVRHKVGHPEVESVWTLAALFTGHGEQKSVYDRHGNDEGVEAGNGSPLGGEYHVGLVPDRRAEGVGQHDDRAMRLASIVKHQLQSRRNIEEADNEKKVFLGHGQQRLNEFAPSRRQWNDLSPKSLESELHQIDQRDRGAKAKDKNTFALLDEINRLMQGIAIDRFQGLGHVVDLGYNEALKDIT